MRERDTQREREYCDQIEPVYVFNFPWVNYHKVDQHLYQKIICSNFSTLLIYIIGKI